MKELIVGSDYSGVGAFDQSLIRLGVPFKKLFACDFDYNARITYVLNFGTDQDLEIAKSKEHKMFCDGMEFIILGKDAELENCILEAINPKLTEKEHESLLAKIEKLKKELNEFEKKCKKLSIDAPDLETRKFDFSEAADHFATTFSFYYPFNVYDREIPEESLDIFMTSPPCQAFSLAGKRLGKDDIKGILFFNSLDFIQKNKPKSFVFENVKGLLSDDKTNKSAQYGNTFQEWINYLGGKSINGVPTIFTYEDSVPYHIYFKVLNAKDYGVPQNRERIFIIGIRDDEDNNFQFPKEFPLEKRLKDILEPIVDEKYFLSEKLIDWITSHREKRESKNPFPMDNDSVSGCITSRYYKTGAEDPYIGVDEIIQLNDPKHSNDRVYSDEGISPTLNTMQGGNRQPFVQVSAEVIQLNQSKESGGKQPYQHNRIYDTKGISPALDTDSGGRKNILVDEEVKVVAFGRSEEEKKRRKEHFQKTGQDSGSFKDKTLILKDQEYYDTLLASPNPKKEGLIFINANTKKGFEKAEEEEDSINFSNPNSKTRRGRVGKKVAQTLDTACNQGVFTQQRIRRLTPTECFRLMDFNPEMIEKTIQSGLISDSQLYKQAGNSIVVNCLVVLLQKLLKL